MAEYLHVYSLKVRPSGEPGNYKPLRDMDGRKSNFVDWFVRDMEARKKAGNWHKYTDADTTVKVTRAERLDANTIHGTFEAGHLGDRFKIGDASDPNKDVHDKSRDEPIKLPLYFRVHCPPGATIGMLMTQRSGSYGVKSTFWETDTVGAFERAHGGLKLEFGVLHPSGVAEAYENNGQLKELVLTTWSPPTRVATGISIVEIEDVSKMEVRFTPRRGKALHLAQDVAKWFKGEGDMPKLLELQLADGEGGLKLPMEQIAVTVRLGKRDRKVAISTEAAKFRGASYPIEPALDSDDWPVFSSVANEASDLQTDLVDSLE